MNEARRYTERLRLTDYTMERTVKSKIDISKKIVIKKWLECPRCRGIHDIPKHGEDFICVSCGLEMISWGNALHCTLKITDGTILREDTVERLNAIKEVKGADVKAEHSKADEILIEFLRSAGFSDIADAWEALETK